MTADQPPAQEGGWWRVPQHVTLAPVPLRRMAPRSSDDAELRVDRHK